MTAPRDPSGAVPRRRRPPVSAVSDLLVVVTGMVVLAGSVDGWLADGRANPWLLLAIPLIVAMTRFPLVLLRTEGDITVGFEAAVLVVLALLAPIGEALTIWAAAILLAQVATRKRWTVRAFNVGLATSVGAVAVAVMHVVDPLTATRPRELAAVALGCAAYFVADFVLTAASIAFETGGQVFAGWHDASVKLSFAVFVGIDTLGYVGAVLARDVPWTLPLLAAPIATLLLAARAFARARRNQVLMTGLFDAALLAQTSTTRDEILALLVQQVRRVLRCADAGLRDSGPAPGEIGVLLGEPGSGRYRWLVAPPRVSGEPYSADDQRSLQTLAVLGRESLQRAELVQEMAHLARHDPLTGLPNRALFHDRVTQAVARQRREARPLAVLFVDLDGFKGVNDTLGHEIGDQLLVAVATRLRGCLRPADTVARLGGDEFAVLLEQMADPSHAGDVSERLLAALGLPFSLGGTNVAVGASIGIALYRPGDDADALLRSSDLAMYRAKERGKGRFEMFEPTMLTAARDRLALEAELRTVVQRDELRLAYQPVVDLVTGRVHGFEALLRWDHPELGTVNPMRFVGVAEDTGLILDIGRWVLDRAYADAVHWSREQGRRVVVGVNVSGRQLRGGALVGQVRRLVEAHPDDGADLVLEITESVLVSDDGEALDTLRAVRDLGVRLAIDDFGTGYSSIAYLRHLPVDVLKIDRSFVHELAGDAKAAAIVEAIRAMTDSLDLELVAEGIEEAGQLAALRTLGCRLGQGYWFAAPMDAEAAGRFLAAGRVDVAAPPQVVGAQRGAEGKPAGRRLPWTV